jgi:nitrate reductase NapAB chaperone NapD
MPVNGLLITLTEDETLSSDALLAIAKHDCIELGDRTDRWQPVVVETSGTRDSHEIHEWLEALPGVIMVDVVFSSVADPDDPDGANASDEGHQDTEGSSDNRNQDLIKS